MNKMLSRRCFPLSFKSKEDKRKYHRQYKKTGEVVEIDFHPYRIDFRTCLIGLLVDESLGGCGLIVITDEDLEVNQVLRLKIEQEQPLKARIAWLQKNSHNIFRLGLEYFDF